MAANKFLIFQQQNQRQNEKYKVKLKLLKTTIKNLLYENAALCDQVAQIQENILCVKEERRFLLKKLIEFENEVTFGGNALTPVNNSGTFNDISSTPIKKTAIKKRSNSEANSESSFKSKTGSVSSVKMKPVKPPLAKKQQQEQQQIQQQQQQQIQQQQQQQIQQQQQQHQQHQQQQEQHQVIQTITLPIELTGFVLHAIGDVVCDRLGYHAENCIYPVGYVISRVYSHIKDPELKCSYTCQIIDNGDSPRFEIIPEVDSEYIISGPSPDYCHTTLLQLIHSATDTRNTNIRPQGEWFFGLTDPTVINLILNNPNAQNCVNFKGFCAEVIEQNEHNSNVNFEALQNHLNISAYHTVPEIKEEPPDELLDHSDNNNFNVC